MWHARALLTALAREAKKHAATRTAHQSIARGVRALPPTPQNYAIWFEYHAGQNDKLRRALTVALTNRRSIDGYMMAELHDLFFADTVERRAAREALGPAMRHAAQMANDRLQEFAARVGIALRDLRHTL